MSLDNDLTFALNLDDVAAGNGGFKIIGEDINGETGYAAGTGFSVSEAGDVNGDGIDDVIVGAPGNVGATESGSAGPSAAYVVFGQQGGLGTVNLADIAAGNGGFKIVAESEGGDWLGQSVAAAGDVNGDGFDDVIVGAPYAGPTPGVPDPDAGAAYVVFGRSEGLGTVNLTDVAAGNGGFRVVGENAGETVDQLGDFLGRSVSGAGDVNGDGIDDVIIGANLNDEGGDDAGAAYVIFGRRDGFQNVDLADIAAGNGGFKIVGENAEDRVGRSVSAAGDVNGDGIDDVIVGSNLNSEGGEYAGAAYVIYGRREGFGTINLDDIAAGSGGGFKIVGESAGDRAGISVSRAGDFNDDGLDDVIVGAPFNDEAGEDAGAAYLIFGARERFGNVNLTDVAAGDGGFKIVGENADDRTGYSVSDVGDINDDGEDDVIVGAALEDTGGDRAGAAYVIFGREDNPGTVNLHDIAAGLFDFGIAGFKIVGENENDRAGTSVSKAGDVNADGEDDLILGAPLNDAGGEDAGAAYVVYGSDLPGPGNFDFLLL